MDAATYMLSLPTNIQRRAQKDDVGEKQFVRCKKCEWQNNICSMAGTKLYVTETQSGQCVSGNYLCLARQMCQPTMR